MQRETMDGLFDKLIYRDNDFEEERYLLRTLIIEHDRLSRQGIPWRSEGRFALKEYYDDLRARGLYGKSLRERFSKLSYTTLGDREHRV